MKDRAVLCLATSALVSLGAARAEVLTLRCVNPPQQKDWTIDVDLTNSTVTVTSGGPSAASSHADISDRSIEFADPFAPSTFRMRIDRMTGVWWVDNLDADQYAGSGPRWIGYGSCSRLQKPLF